MRTMAQGQRSQAYQSPKAMPYRVTTETSKMPSIRVDPISRQVCRGVCQGPVLQQCEHRAEHGALPPPSHATAAAHSCQHRPFTCLSNGTDVLDGKLPWVGTTHSLVVSWVLDMLPVLSCHALQLTKQELRGRGRESHVGLHLPNEEGSLWKKLETVKLNPTHGVRLRETEVPVRCAVLGAASGWPTRVLDSPVVVVALRSTTPRRRRGRKHTSAGLGGEIPAGTTKQAPSLTRSRTQPVRGSVQ